ncbi:hypothetical protein Y032_0283g1308 [Ancylostoma ceylanicum]|uniref:Uncharacterized protein n=1 Tax=Ancylostoma ceylanicum TaxID=53326 RepID=A0A016S7F9_9BILA|nr:hypothetical protein Y032_0283g1308 [Ancylostoma ceylanicum]
MYSTCRKMHGLRMASLLQNRGRTYSTLSLRICSLCIPRPGWLGQNGASAVLSNYRYFINEVDCISKESVCALYVWRSTGHTNYTIASSDCVSNYDKCKNLAKECCITSVCARKQRRMFLSLVKRFKAKTEYLRVQGISVKLI